MEEDPVKNALDTFFKAFPPGPTGIEGIELQDAIGRVLADNVEARVDSPPFSRTLTDGYVVNVKDTISATETHPVSLKILGVIEPGMVWTDSIPQGYCREVRTGSYINEGEYGVISSREAERSGDHIIIRHPVNKGHNIEEKGCEIKKGDLLLKIGKRLNLQDIMLLASQGMKYIDVARKPVVAIYSSGNEILSLSQPMQPGKIWDVNSYTLFALTIQYGGMPLSIGAIKDDFDTFQRALRAGLSRVDMAVISGGTAAQGKDFIVEVINSIDDPGVIINGLPIRSGKPLKMAVLGEKPVVCVAGYPPEAIRGFELIGKPTISRLLGERA